MKLRTVFSIALLICPAALVAQLSVPKVGVARYADHTVRGINGLESNLLVDSQAMLSADAVSFSDRGGLLSIAGTIRLITNQGTIVGEFNSGESSPVLNIDGDLTSAIAWLPSSGLLVYWNGKAFAATQVIRADLPGAVTSVQAAGATAAKLLANDPHGNVFQVSVSLATGDVTSVNLLPGIKGRAFEQYGYIVFHDSNSLAIQAPNGAVRSLALTAQALTFERMSSEWVHIASPVTHQDWALHLTNKAVQLSILPAPSASTGDASQMRRAQEVER